MNILEWIGAITLGIIIVGVFLFQVGVLKVEFKKNDDKQK